MEKHPEVEKLEIAALLIEDAFLKYKESITILNEALESILSLQSDSSLSTFQKNGCHNHQKEAVRQTILLLEGTQDADTMDRFKLLSRELTDISTFMHPLKK